MHPTQEGHNMLCPSWVGKEPRLQIFNFSQNDSNILRFIGMDLKVKIRIAGININKFKSASWSLEPYS